MKKAKLMMLLALVFLFVFPLNSCMDPLPGGGTGSTASAESVKARFKDLMNDYRVANGKEEFLEHWVFTKIAQDWVDYQASVDQYLAHDGFQDRVREAERLLGMSIAYVAENCAMNSGYADPAWVAYDGLIHSSGHRKNILMMTVCGTGVARSKSGKYYFCQFFAL
ncbi:MAG: CAP domain-containing protein [Thermotogota bacterium]|nr:CAP domain-containing protein [Thermotogota bacterium]